VFDAVFYEEQQSRSWSSRKFNVKLFPRLVDTARKQCLLRLDSSHEKSMSFTMANDDTESSRARPASPLKRVETGKGEIRASKRRKVDHGDHPPSTRELAPKPSPAINDVSILVPSQPSYAKPKTKPSSNKRRATSLNLKNYPSNHHPVAIGVWILQKVEQARKELENQRFESDSSEPPRIGLQGEHLTVDLPPGYTVSPHCQPSSVENGTVPFGQELEAERLQAQRNRKTKQRQENWAKSESSNPMFTSCLRFH
jgi:hypothetical protein